VTIGGSKSVLRGLLPRRVGPHRILRGPLRGARLVTSWHDYPAALLGYTERPLVDWFIANVKPGETWLDIGAHYGYTALALSRLVGRGGHVFAFEPVLSTAGCLEATRLQNDLGQLTIVPFGLTATPHLVPIKVPLIRGMADHGREPTNLTTIFAVALDEVWEFLSPHSRIDGVKIDVQGMELAVLDGMKDTLRRWHPKLIVELHEGVDRSSLRGLLKLVGYSSTGAAIESPSPATDKFEDDRSYLFLASDPV
jgi:FkbM family methyltransferase